MKPLAPARVAARALAAEALRTTLDALARQGHGGATLRAIARRLGVSHTQVERLCGDGDPAVAVGDVLAMGREVARPYLRALLAQLDTGAGAVSLGDAVLDVQVAAGRVAEALREARRDQVVSLDELAVIEGTAHRTMAECSTVLAACAQERARLSGSDR